MKKKWIESESFSLFGFISMENEANKSNATFAAAFSKTKQK